MPPVTSCADATAPILLQKNTSQICNLKCSYSFNYPPSNINILNHGDYLSWKIAETNIAPVIYNDEFYNVQEVRIYWNSVHAYGLETTKADAEFFILHNNPTSTKSLIVCVPIIKSSTATDDCTTFFDLILSEIGRTAPASGDQTTYNHPNLSLNKFVPMKPYFSYSGTLPWTPCNGDYNYIVYHKDSAITMSPHAYGLMTKGMGGSAIINKHAILPNRGNPKNLFYNATGPKKPNSGEIFIDCQPTGDDGEVLVPAKLDTGGILDNEVLKRMWNKSFVKIIIGALVMIAIWKLSMKAINGIAGNTARMASATIKSVTD